MTSEQEADDVAAAPAEAGLQTGQTKVAMSDVAPDNYEAIEEDTNLGNTASQPKWSPNAPKGGRVVLARALKDSAAVPLFLAQTFTQSLRDVGYDSTISALCEHVDNAIGAEATEIRVQFRQTGRKGDYKIDVLVQDNGSGMAPNVLKVATSFGGSMQFNNRRGIGRFGMGMKTAGLSMAPAIEILSWQEMGAYYRMVLDTEAIGRDRSNLIQLDDPEYMRGLTADMQGFFTNPLSFPKDSNEQVLLAPRGIDLEEALGAHGTIVFMPDCDRLSAATARTLVEDATKTFAHVYRRPLTKGLRIYVNNRMISASDPTLSMTSARHTTLSALEGVSVKTSRLVSARSITVQLTPASSTAFEIQVRIYALPIREWSRLSRKAQIEIGVFNDQIVSILRNDREVFAGTNAKIVSRHNTSAWLRVEIDFPGELDEAFGVAANKQGVRMKEHVVSSIRKAIAEDLLSIRTDIETVQANNAIEKKGAGLSPAELKAKESDPFQADRLDAELTAAERQQMDENLRGLSVALKRENETSEEAFDRVKDSTYIIAYKSDRYWPFFAVENQFGRVILTINTLHPFYIKFYEPLLKLATVPDAEENEEAGYRSADGSALVTMADLLLLSMARSQTIISQGNSDAEELFETFRRSWSDTLKVQMSR